MAERGPPKTPEDAELSRVIHRASDLVARARGPAPGQVPPPPGEVPLLSDGFTLGPEWVLATHAEAAAASIGLADSPTRGQATIDHASTGQGSVGRASIDNAARGRPSIGQASTGEASIGQASIGQASIGQSSSGRPLERNSATLSERERHALAERITKAVQAQIENELPVLVRAALDHVLEQDSTRNTPPRHTR